MKPTNNSAYQDWRKIEHVQFPITAYTNIRAGQAIRLDRMELAASIRATNSDDCCGDIAYRIGNRHRIA